MDMRVRPARPEDHQRLLELWERSVRATHHFLADSDVVALRPLVAEVLESDSVDWWVLVSTGMRRSVSWVCERWIEALSSTRIIGARGGKFLVAHAQSLAAGALAVDVNEQNEAGSSSTRRSGSRGRAVGDGLGGRPFPSCI